MQTKRVCIIGAGSSGLAAAKHMTEQGLLPVIYEKNSVPGGLWSSSSTNRTAIWEGLYANISLYAMSFSDHPYPDHTSLVPSLNEVKSYLNSYIKRFKLEQYLKLNTNVISAIQTEDKKWHIKSINNQTNEINESLFDYLIVASGLHYKPKIPKFENMEKFKGILMHSADFKLEDESLKSKKVIVVGSASSGTDISSNLAGHAKLVVNIFRRPSLISPRLIGIKAKTNNTLDHFVRPFDFCMFTYATVFNGAITDEEKIKYNMEHLPDMFYEQICNKNINEAIRYDIQKEVDIRAAMSDFYLAHVKSGKIIPKRTAIKRFEENGVRLLNGELEECDAVILCTGFNSNVSYFDENILKKLNYDCNSNKSPFILFKFTFHPEVENLAIIQHTNALYFSGAEIQCIWASLIFSGKKSLPSKHLMYQDMDDEKERRCLDPKDKHPYNHNILIKLISEEAGCLPDFDTLKQSDPDLYRMLWNNLSSSAHFILNDPAKRDYAIEIIKEIDALTNKIYTFDDNSEYNDDYYQQICNVGREFFKENSGRYSVPNYFL